MDWHQLFHRENERNRQELLDALERVAALAAGVGKMPDASFTLRSRALTARQFCLEMIEKGGEPC